MELPDIVGPVILFSFLLFYYVFSCRFANPKASMKNTPPEAGGAWPFIGHLQLLSRGSSRKLPHFSLADMADKYGPIFTIRLGTHRALVVSNWKLTKELFTTSDVVVSSRPKSMAAVLLGYNMAMFGFSPYDTYWKELRKVISVELLSSRRVELQKHVLLSETTQSIKELYSLWEEKKDASGRALVEMKEWFGDLNLNVVLRMVVGKRCFGSSGDSDEARKCRQVMRDFFHLAGMFTMGDALPYLRWLDIGAYEKKMKQTSKELDALVGQWLQEHRDEGDYKVEGKQRDFMDVMLSVVQSAKLQSEVDDDTIIKSTCANLMSGASDTTTIMLVWSLCLLLNNRNVLKKAQEELDHHVGRERRVNESDIGNLVYLKAIAKETLRLYPAGPLSGLREFNQDSTLGGYNVQKGTWLIVNMWKLHRDPHIWSEAEEFRPERFFTTHKDMDVKGQDFELIPFGAGRRMCPGLHFGIRMMHLVLANLLHSFDFSTPSDALVDMTETGGMTNGKATPLEVHVAPRLPASLY